MADGISVWIPVITALAGIGGALGSQYVSHRFALQREERTAATKLARERLFIATELVFLLEQFADACCDVVTGTDADKEHWSGEPLPALSYASVEGDWRSLPAKLLYRIRFLPALEQEARFRTRFVLSKCTPADASDCARFQYARVGLKALMTAYRLRIVCSLPLPRKGELRWIVGEILWRNWRASWRTHLLILQRLKEGI